MSREPFDLNKELDALNREHAGQRQREPWDAEHFDPADYYDGDDPIFFDIDEHLIDRQREADDYWGRS